MSDTDPASWPGWATAAVEIADPDPEWPRRAAGLIAALATRLGPWLRHGIHHVGSTAVPGMPAKPVIDLMAGVATLDAADAIDEALRPDGWRRVPPELDRRPWRRLFVLPDSDRRVAHLHVTTADARRWREQLAFRDRLRAEPALRDEYAALKRRLAAAHGGDREAYTEGKGAFVARVIAGRA